MPRTRAPCVWNSLAGGRSRAGDRRNHRLLPPGGGGVPPACSWPAWSIWTALREGGGLRHQGQIATGPAEDGADWRHRRRTTKKAVGEAASHIVRLCNARVRREGFIAVTPEARKKFWLDRSRTAAISRHTNAFKINEDVVIPLPRMGDYPTASSASTSSCRWPTSCACRRAAEFSTAACRWTPAMPRTTDELMGDRRQARSIDAVRRAGLAAGQQPDGRAACRGRPPASPNAPLEPAPPTEQPAANPCFHRLQDFPRACPGRRELLEISTALFVPTIERSPGEANPPAGAARPRLRRPAHARWRRQRAYQHPGQPDDYDMLQTAHGGRAHHGAGARPDGVISASTASASPSWNFVRRRNRPVCRLQNNKVDPKGHFNQGKLMPGADLAMPTPPFSCWAHRIADHGAIRPDGDFRLIKDCLRCGKCKPVCSTHVPRANLLYSRATRFLGTSLLTEAFLYEGTNPARRFSRAHLTSFNDVGRPLHRLPQVREPCPVNIDFGDVSIKPCATSCASRARKIQPGTAAAMAFLNAKGPGHHQADARR